MGLHSRNGRNLNESYINMFLSIYNGVLPYLLLMLFKKMIDNNILQNGGSTCLLSDFFHIISIKNTQNTHKNMYFIRNFILLVFNIKKPQRIKYILK